MIVASNRYDNSYRSIDYRYFQKAIKLKNRKVMGELSTQRIRKRPEKSVIEEIKNDLKEEDTSLDDPFVCICFSSL